MREALRRQFTIPVSTVRNGLLLLFFLSGLSGLIYQSVWAQYLGLLLGHTAYAQALVLAVFMGGMGLGAVLVAGYAERWLRLIRAYPWSNRDRPERNWFFIPLFVAVTDWSRRPLPVLDGPAAIGSGLKWGKGSPSRLFLPQSMLLGNEFSC